MKEYLDEGVLQPRDGIVYVERTVSGKTRKGIILCLDLERYDYNKGSASLIRATEGTIVDRLPPRMKIREGALLELPHILVLIDDPQRTVIEPLVELRDIATDGTTEQLSDTRAAQPPRAGPLLWPQPRAPRRSDPAPPSRGP